MMRRNNCSLVGGHTCEGHDSALGFAVTGTVHPRDILPKGPPRPGHVLILTKGIGTGTLMAADMRGGLVAGSCISSMNDSMLQLNQEAGKVLSRFGCVACTDVTGFGVMGHLLEMMQHGESDDKRNDDEDDDTEDVANCCCRVDLFLKSVPLLPGAAG